MGVLSYKRADSIFHPPSGSNVPGRGEDNNPYLNSPPDTIRALLETETDKEELLKMKSALKQWERVYSYPGYPFKKAAESLRVIARAITAEIENPPEQVTYYYDSEVPSGTEEILESLEGLYDNYNQKREDIPRQGERPIRDIDIGKGDFSAPHDPVVTDVKPRGDGPDPEGLECEEPPTGGDIGGWPDGL
jgi:hypothetical protein